MRRPTATRTDLRPPACFTEGRGNAVGARGSRAATAAPSAAPALTHEEDAPIRLAEPSRSSGAFSCPDIRLFECAPAS